ncbi:MAG: SDR family NAD(P)-dependent oxidoreductase [Pirellulaceae bacterium]
MNNVLVTGGTRGLGLATAARLARDGYHVIATGRRISPELAELVARSWPTGRVSFAELDLAQPAKIHEFVQATTATHGPLYGLVNNAAVGHDGVLATMHESQIEELVQVNILSAIFMAKYACRSMLLQRAGRIVNVASVIAHTGFNGLSVYAATKSALIGFTKSLARELGKAHITVNTVSPGYMETAMTQAIDTSKLDAIRRRSPLGQLVAVTDVAEAIAFLMSDRAAMITGADFKVDAGSTA